MTTIFVIVIGSFELPCYYEFIRMRKAQLNRYAIPHMFVFDAPIPVDYTPDSNDFFFEKSPGPYPVSNSKNSQPSAMCPHMTIKFLRTLQTLEEKKYDFVVRCNLSTYIHFPRLVDYLGAISTRPFAGGYLMKFPIPDWSINPHDSIQFISGTCMVFSSDIITFFKSIPIHSYILYEHEDDVVLSFLAKFISNTFHSIPVLLLENDRYPDQNELNTHMIFRIKHYADRIHDVEKWKFLDSLYNSTLVTILPT
jgi:hypothetical protein